MWAYIYVVGSVVMVAFLLSYIIWTVKNDEDRGL